MQVILRLKDTYLALIHNSLGTFMFRQVFADVDGNKEDIAENGHLSCAIFASSILYLVKLIAVGPHATVKGMIHDMEKSGWNLTEDPKPGAVIVWEKADYSGRGDEHLHIGFYIGNNEAISNSSKDGVPMRHHWTYGETDGKPTRKITAIYWHPKLDT